MTLYLVKYISEQGRYEILKPTESVTHNGVVFGLGTNIVTTSGPNSLADTLTGVSGAVSVRVDQLTALAMSVSGASSLRDDAQDLLLQSVSGTLKARVDSVSGASSLRDDAQDLLLQSVSGALKARVDSVSGASSLRDDAQDSATAAVSGNLQGQINAIVADFAREERFEATAGQSLFTLSTIAFDPSPTRRDLQVFKNGVRVYQSLNGTVSGTVSGGDWEKVGTTQVRFLRAGGLEDGDRVVVRDERTGGGNDVQHLTVDIAPSVAGGQFVGLPTRPFAGVYVADGVSAGVVWRIGVSGGSLYADQV